MSFGISKTIPKAEGAESIQVLYDGSIREYEFHKAGGAGQLKTGDYVYTIFNDQLIGRLKITRLVEGAIHPDSGQPRTLIYVACPGERLEAPVPKKSHRGTRYYDGADWPDE